MLNFQSFSGKEINQTEIIKNKVKGLRCGIKKLRPWFPEKFNIQSCNENLRTLLLVKYVYYKVILGDNIEAEKLLFVTTNNFIKADIYWTGSAIIYSHFATDNVVDEDNNILISDEDLGKCFHILELFECLKDCYSKISGIGEDINEIQNYDKFVTQKFFNNIIKINNINISESCQTCSFNVPIILPSKRIENACSTKIQKWIEEYKRPDNVFSDMDLVIDWLFKNCEHVETFEIGLFVATSQALYVTEGFDAFKKFLIYAESLDGENRIRFVNVLISIFNNFNKNIETDNYFYIIPIIIMALDLCDKFLEYPLSVAGSVLDATSEPPIFEDFRIKFCTNFQLFNDGIENLRNNPDNIVRKQDCETKSCINFQQFINQVKDFMKNHKKNVVEQDFGRNKTIPMQAIIDEYDKLAEKCEMEIKC